MPYTRTLCETDIRVTILLFVPADLSLRNDIIAIIWNHLEHSRTNLSALLIRVQLFCRHFHVFLWPRP